MIGTIGIGLLGACAIPSGVNSPAVESGGSFHPTGNVFVFARAAGRWGDSGRAVLHVTHHVEGRWSAPAPLPFSGVHDDSDPFFTPDGRQLLFISDRPADGPASDDIWRVRYLNGDWGVPERLGPEINSAYREFSPVMVGDGSIYFASMRPGGTGQGDLYVSRRKDDGRFATAAEVGGHINSEFGEWNLFVPPDESYLVFESSHRETNRSAAGDLYISYPVDGDWSAPVPLSPINTAESELNFGLCPGGEVAYFARSITEPDGRRHADLVTVSTEDILPHRARSSRLAVVARGGHELWLIDAENWRPLRRVAVGTGPHEVAAHPGGPLAAVANYGVYPEYTDGRVVWQSGPSGTVSVVDADAGVVTRELAVPGCERNHAIHFADDGATFWTSCENTGEVAEIDFSSGKVTRHWKTEPGSHVIATAPGERVVVTNVDSGSVSIIDRLRGEVVTVATGAGAEGLAVDPDNGHAWIGNAQEDTISVLDTRTGRVLRSFPSAGRFPVKIARSGDTGNFWVVNTFSRSVAVFEPGADEPRHTHEFDSPPLGIAISPEGGKIALSFPRLGELRVFDTRTMEVIATVRGIKEADGIAWLSR